MEAQTHRLSSSSSSTTTPSSDHDVFLSFSSKDTCNTFISNLCHGLVQAGITTFMAENEMEEGDNICPPPEEAITRSRIFIPIFSASYASSKRCVDELALIMESRATKGQSVCPIFFDVDPLDVRDQKNDFGQQFDQLAKKFDQGIVERWKNALTESGELKGWDLKDVGNGNVSKVIQLVLERVWSELSKRSYEHLIGIDSCVMRLLNLFSVEPNGIQFVGVWGMGGIGKTTIAEAVFERIHRNFDGSIFLEDVRESSKLPEGLVCLQQQLLSAILKQQMQFISNVGIGKLLIKEHLHNKKVLICLDGVDRTEHLEVLAGGPDWFGPGSRIIITTRDRHVLKMHQVQEIFEAKELDFDQSRQLFSKHAFGKNKPPDDFMKLAEDMVLWAGGLPLALKALGSFLSDKGSPTVWRSTLHRLRKIPLNDVHEKLKTSLEELGEDEKRLFLDIACFFIGADKEYAIDIWEGCGFVAEIGIILLIQKSLVKIDCDNKLRMHNQLRDMARHIVFQENPDEPGKRSRLSSREEVMNILKGMEGTKNVEGIICKLEGEEAALEKIHVRTDAFEMMSKLRLLQIDNVHLKGDFRKLPSDLRWLSWKGCPLESITNFHLEELSVLDLSYSRIKQVSDQNMRFQELKVLILSNCRFLAKAPDFSRLLNLEKLNLEGCIKLKALPSSICNLMSLKKLILSGCSNLKKLPYLHRSVNQLEVLKLEHCKLLSRLPDWIGDMKNLKILSADGTMITELPDTFGFLENIEELTVKKCKKLGKLPCSMGKMRCLRRFEIDETGINELPEDFGMLSCLEVLRMPGCLRFRLFPENFGSLIRLRDLNIGGNSKLQRLPVSFSCLCSLTSLDASGCKLVEDVISIDFGKLSSLKNLYLSYSNFCSLPISISALSRLENLGLDNCRNLKFIPELPLNLCILNVKDCVSLETLPNLSYMKSLRILDLSNCKKLADIQGTEKMESLQELWMSGCSIALVESVKKNLGQLLLQSLQRCCFPECEVPYRFTPTLKVSDSLIWSGGGHEIRLECEDVPTSLWNLEQQWKITGVILCFVFRNQSETSAITIAVQVKRNGGCVYSNSGYPFIIFSKRHQDQICLCQFRDLFGNVVSRLEEGDEVSFIIQTRLDTEVKKGGIYVVYDNKIRGDLFGGGGDDDDGGGGGDDDGGGVIVVDDDDDSVIVIDDDVAADDLVLSTESMKRKFELLNDDNSYFSSTGGSDRKKGLGESRTDRTSITWCQLRNFDDSTCDDNSTCDDYFASSSVADGSDQQKTGTMDLNTDLSLTTQHQQLGLERPQPSPVPIGLQLLSHDDSLTTQHQQPFPTRLQTHNHDESFASSCLTDCSDQPRDDKTVSLPSSMTGMPPKR